MSDAQAAQVSKGQGKVREDFTAVVGKHFPISAYGTLISRYPFLVLLIALVLPTFFATIVLYDKSVIELSLSGFEVTPHESTTSKKLIATSLSKWYQIVGNTSRFSSLSASSLKERSVPYYRQEIRYVFNRNKFVQFALSGLRGFGRVNLLHKPNLEAIRDLEKNISSLSIFSTLCLFGDFKGGVVSTESNRTVRACAPLNSLTTYFFPGDGYIPTTHSQADDISELIALRGSDKQDWVSFPMDGQGDTYQSFTQRVATRMLRNPNLRWFVDASFDVSRLRVLSVRSQITLGGSVDVAPALENVRVFTQKVIELIELYWNHPYVDIAFGGDQVEETKLAHAVQREAYKVYLAVVIVLIVVYAHTRSGFTSLMLVLQVVLTFLGGWGIHVSIFRQPLPLLVTVSLFVVVSFSLQGTLAVRDAFVHSGIMHSTGRSNNLSVAQRISFTLRRAVTGVVIADTISGCVFAANCLSAFPAVRQFSLFMIASLLLNMYQVLTITPCVVTIHHYYFSNRNAAMQKYRDLHRSKAEKLQRHPIMTNLLKQTERMNVEALRQAPYVERFGTLKALFEHEKNRLEILNAAQATVSKMPVLREINSLIHSLQTKVRGYHLGGRTVTAESADDGIALFTLRKDIFDTRYVLNVARIEMPLKARNEGAGLVDLGNTLLQLPLEADSEFSPREAESSSSPLLEVRVAKAFVDAVEDADVTLPETSAEDTMNIGLRALIAHQIVCEMYGCSIVGPVKSDRPTGERAASNSTTKTTNWFSRVKARLSEGGRQYCCGFIGKRMHETREERNMRLQVAGGSSSQEYTHMHRLMYSILAPFVNRGRFPLTIISIAVCAAAIFLSTTEKSAGIPHSLFVNTSSCDAYARAGMSFGMQEKNDCDWCSAFYRPITEQRSLKKFEALVCDTISLKEEMNAFVDQCGTCIGRSSDIVDACVDCFGEPFGSSIVFSCGICDAKDAFPCKCLSTASCSSCEFYLGSTFAQLAGPTCSVTCASCVHGICNRFTGACECFYDEVNGYWSGENCTSCDRPFFQNAKTGLCTDTCGVEETSLQCMCDLDTSQCTTCQPGKIGYRCDADSIQCFNGGRLITTIDSGTAENKCECPDFFADGEQCRYEEVCSFRGSYYKIDTTLRPGCGCRGNWFGFMCNLCQCQNGGHCLQNGTCQCAGAFTGDQCQACAATCSLHGSCPDRFRPEFYSLRSCIAVFCEPDYSERGLICPACQSEWILQNTSSLCHTLGFRDCQLRAECYWYSLAFGIKCLSAINPLGETNASDCKCRGAWRGRACEICGAPSGSTCLPSGNFMACNGQMYIDVNLAPAEDSCGVCGGANMCTGCDGVLNSGITYDQCGVCGGQNECLNGVNAVSIPVTFFVDLSSSPNDLNDLPRQLSAVCSTIEVGAQPVFMSPIRCIPRDFALWIVSQDGSDYANRTAPINQRTLPHLLYRFAQIRNRLSEIGFTDDYRQVTFVNVLALLSLTTAASNAEKYLAYQSMLKLSKEAESVIGSGARVYQTSPSWESAIAAVMSLESMKFTSGIGLSLTFALTFIFFGSFQMALISVCFSGLVLACTLATSSIMSWDLDAVMQICIAVVLAVASEHTIHIVDGFLDYIQTTQSHMFAIQTTKFHCFRGALVRTGLSTLSTSVCVLALAAMFVGSVIQPFSRAANVIITVHVILVLGYLFLGAWMCIFGSTRIVRDWKVGSFVCVLMTLAAGVCLIVIYFTGGVQGPNGDRMLRR